MALKKNPGARPGAPGFGMTFKAGELNVTPSHSNSDDELHHALRLHRLRHRHGLSGPLAAFIASLAFDGGRR